MLKLEYEIKLSELGRPYIELPLDYENNPEDKYFAIEMTRTLLTSFYNRRKNEVDKTTSDALDLSINLLGQVGDEMAYILYNNMIAQGELDRLINNKPYYGVFESIDELRKVGDYVCYESKLYKKENGLCVLVKKDFNNFDEDTLYIFIEDDWLIYNIAEHGNNK